MFITFLLAGQTNSAISDIMFQIDKIPAQITDYFSPEIVIAIKDLTGGSIDLANLDIRKLLAEYLQSNQETLIKLSSTAIRDLGKFIISLAFTVFTLYFFLRDGKFLKGLFIKAIPINLSYMTSLIKKFRESARKLIGGNLLVALIQAIIALILFSIFQVKNALLYSFLVAIFSFIPIIGAGLVWIPLSLSYIIQVDPVKGVLFLVLSGTLISLLDSFYRPLLLGGPVNLHPLPVFYAIVGGVTLFGINGLILGPLILILFFAVLDMFRDLYKMPGGGDDAII